MSRIGKAPITLPAGVEVSARGRELTVKGPKGTLSWERPRRIGVKVEDNVVTCERERDDKISRQLHGLTRALVNNMVQGVSEGFQKKLEIQGVGYQARMQGDRLTMQIGFSHPVEMAVPEGLVCECPDPTHIVVTGIDKQKVGQFAAEIRKVRKPEPYKGKGIRYEGEVVQRKAGKAFVGGGG